MGSSLAQLVECRTCDQEDESLFWVLIENVLLSKHSIYFGSEIRKKFSLFTRLIICVGQKVNIFNSAFVFLLKIITEHIGKLFESKIAIVFFSILSY